jgi:hypothetical protein
VVDPAEGRVHRPPEGGADPDPADDRSDADGRRVVPDPLDGVLEGLGLDVGKEALDVEHHALLDLGAVDDLAEREQDEQREREDREHQVVGDHAGEAGDVLLVGPVPKAARPWVLPRSFHARRTALTSIFVVARLSTDVRLMRVMDLQV